MQDCFREHPDVYGSELEGAEDEDEGAELPGPEQTHAASTETSSRPAGDKGDSLAHKAKFNSEPSSAPHSGDGRPPLDLVPDNYKPDAKSEEPVSESEELVTRAAHTADGDVKIKGRK
jgi:intermembrane space import and assembly protein 40